MYKRTMGSHIETAVEFMYNGSPVYGEISIDLDGDFEQYPYMDTLAFLSNKKKRLTNIPKKKAWFLHSVDGDCYRCEDCEGDVIIQPYREDEFCDECGLGHQNLMNRGIETKWNKKMKEKRS